MSWLGRAAGFFGLSQKEAEANNYKLNQFQDLDKINDSELQKYSAIQKHFQQMEMNASTTAFDQHSFTDVLYGGIATDKPTRLAQYRRMSAFPEVSDAMDEIADDCLNHDEYGKLVNLKLNRSDLDAISRQEIVDAFDQYISLFNFEDNMYEYTRDFLTDAELCWENIISKDHPEAGIIKINRIKPETYEFAFDIKTGKILGIMVMLNTDNNQDTGGPQPSASQTPSKNFFNQAPQWESMNVANQQKLQGGQAIFLPMEQLTYMNTGIYSTNNLIVYPVLEKARKAYNQLTLIEDAIIIYRLVRAPERLVFNIDCGNIPRQRAEQEVQKIARRYGSKQCYNPATGSISSGYDAHQMLECLDMNTKVKLLDGRILTITEIEQELKDGKELYTMSCHPKTKEQIPAKIDVAGINRPNAQVMKITLSNKKTITCTLDHKFPTFDEEEVEAKDLKLSQKMASINGEDIYVFTLEILKERMNTGCITVNLKTNGHHTFALDAGIFTYNSYFFVKTPGTSGTEVTTLPAGQNLGELEDLNYFIRKLYISLKIPYNRYAESSTVIEKFDTINREEYRFSKFVMRILNCYSKGLNEGFCTHLKLKGLWSQHNFNDRDFRITFCPPTAFTIYEQMKLNEIRFAQYDLASSHAELSQTLCQRTYLNWSDDQIEENFNMKEKELIRMAQIERAVELAKAKDAEQDDFITQNTDEEPTTSDNSWTGNEIP